ncbi:MAG: hypothetical protein JNM39_16095 [Bdellovibrionaceae bacterium]|nr:hypothetical protein [Pseudobdellovibrionaceae bacterium]
MNLSLIVFGFSFAFVLAIPIHSFGESSEGAIAQQAVGHTKNMLTDSTERAKYMSTDAAAKKQDEKVRELLGSQTENAYELASQLTKTISEKAGGDPKKMEEIVNSLVSDPKSLEKLLTPAQREAIRSMASEVEAQKSGKVSVPGRNH